MLGRRVVIAPRCNAKYLCFQPGRLEATRVSPLGRTIEAQSTPEGVLATLDAFPHGETLYSLKVAADRMIHLGGLSEPAPYASFATRVGRCRGMVRPAVAIAMARTMGELRAKCNFAYSEEFFNGDLADVPTPNLVSLANDVSKMDWAMGYYCHGAVESYSGKRHADALPPSAARTGLRLVEQLDKELARREGGTLRALIALSRMGYYAENALEAMGARLGHIPPMALVRCAWAFAKVSHAPTHIVDDFAKKTVVALPLVRDVDLPRLMWSMAVLYEVHGKEGLPPSVARLDAAVAARVEPMQRSSFPAWGAVQLYQADLQAKTQGRQPPLTLIQRRYTHRVWTRTPTQRSALHTSVSDVLKSMGFYHTNEHNFKGYSIDIAIGNTTVLANIYGKKTEKMPRIAVEVDGPSHWCVNDRERPRGGTALKDGILRSHGWNILHLPFNQYKPINIQKRGVLLSLLTNTADPELGMLSLPARDVDMSELQTTIPLA